MKKAKLFNFLMVLVVLPWLLTGCWASINKKIESNGARLTALENWSNEATCSINSNTTKLRKVRTKQWQQSAKIERINTGNKNAHARIYGLEKNLETTQASVKTAGRKATRLATEARVARTENKIDSILKLRDDLIPIWVEGYDPKVTKMNQEQIKSLHTRVNKGANPYTPVDPTNPSLKDGYIVVEIIGFSSAEGNDDQNKNLGTDRYKKVEDKVLDFGVTVKPGIGKYGDVLWERKVLIIFKKK